MRSVLVLISLLMALAGCDGAPEAGNRYQVSGQFSMGAGTRQFVATYLDSTLIIVEERQRYGDLGAVQARYEVVDGHLVYYRCDESRQRRGSGASGHESVELELAFDTAGTVLSQLKLVDGQPTSLQGYEAPGVQRHFEELRRRAEEGREAARASTSGPLPR